MKLGEIMEEFEFDAREKENFAYRKKRMTPNKKILSNVIFSFEHVNNFFCVLLCLILFHAINILCVSY